MSLFIDTILLMIYVFLSLRLIRNLYKDKIMNWKDLMRKYFFTAFLPFIIMTVILLVLYLS